MLSIVLKWRQGAGHLLTHVLTLSDRIHIQYTRSDDHHFGYFSVVPLLLRLLHACAMQVEIGAGSHYNMLQVLPHR